MIYSIVHMTDCSQDFKRMFVWLCLLAFVYVSIYSTISIILIIIIVKTKKRSMT
jgi:hypothetical protein